MAVNWDDESQIDNFRTTAIDRGVAESEIDNYISQKKTSSVPMQPALKQPDNKIAKQNIMSLKPSQQMQSKQLVGRSLNKTTVQPMGQPMAQPTPVHKEGVRVTQRFGNPNARLYGRNKSGNANTNRGVDIAMNRGEAQYAPPIGKWVVESIKTGSYNSGWGNSVIIKNTDTGETIRRSHLDKVMVRPGQEITGGQIGTTGRTGKSTGYHTDIEYTKNNKLLDFMQSPYAKYL